MNLSALRESIERYLNSLSGDVGFYVKFFDTHEEIKYNERGQFWAASVIKIPILVEFYRQVSEERIDPSERVSVKEENRVDGSGVIKLLDASTNFTLKDLCTLMIAVSDNSATNELIDFVGWENIGAYMQSLGLGDTTFKHKMQIKAGRGPNLTTAFDIALLLEKLHKKELSYSEEILNMLNETRLRDRIPVLLPNNIFLPHKTGSLPEAVHDVGIVYSKRPFVFTFLSDNQKDKVITKQTCANCAKLCFDYSEKSV